METIKYMFDERNPNNLIESRKKCGNCCVSIWSVSGFIILIAGCIVALHYLGTYLLFGFIIATHQDNNRVNGCPNNMNDCYSYQKMICYQEKMEFCHLFGLVTLLGVILGIIVAGVIVTCVFLMLHCIILNTCDGLHAIYQSYDTASNMTKNNANTYNVTQPDSEKEQPKEQPKEEPKEERIQLDIMPSSEGQIQPEEENIPLDDY
jgi:hypothetical protein